MSVVRLFQILSIVAGIGCLVFAAYLVTLIKEATVGPNLGRLIAVVTALLSYYFFLPDFIFVPAKPILGYVIPIVCSAGIIFLGVQLYRKRHAELKHIATGAEVVGVVFAVLAARFFFSL